MWAHTGGEYVVDEDAEDEAEAPVTADRVAAFSSRYEHQALEAAKAETCVRGRWVAERGSGADARRNVVEEFDDGVWSVDEAEEVERECWLGWFMWCRNWC